MFQTLYQKFQIGFAENANRLIFTIKKLKWIGPHISDEWYVRRDIKNAFGVLAIIKSVLLYVILSLLYCGCMLFMPAGVLGSILDWDTNEICEMVVWTFFFLNSLCGSFMRSRIFDRAVEEDYLLLNLLRIDPREHYLTSVLWEHGRQTVFYAVMMLLFLCGWGHWHLWQVLWLLGIYICFRAIGESIKLWLNTKFGMPLEEKNKRVYGIYLFYLIVIVLLAYAGYPALWILGFRQGIGRYLTGMLLVAALAATLLCMLAAVMAVHYLLHYPGYVQVARRTCNRQDMMELDRKAEELSKANYALQDKEVEEAELHAHAFEDKQGYEYLNAIFFARHKRLVRNAVRIKVVVSALILGVSAGLLLVANIRMSQNAFMDMSNAVWQEVNRLLPIIVFFMYCASSGQNLTKAMFYNCDVSLLKYGYYRTSGAILLNFRIRLRYMLKSEFPMVATICCGIVLDALLLRQWQHPGQVLSIILCVGLLAVAYSVVFLCMYYIFQPFTEGGEQTGIGYNVCSGVIYFVSYMCLQIHTVPTFFAGIVLALTLVIVLTAFMLAYWLAPRTFRLK